MPPSDAGVRLPRISFQHIRLPHLEVADDGAQHRSGNILNIEYRIQLARVPADFRVVVVGHDVGGELRHAEPHIQLSAGGRSTIKVPIAVVVKIQKIRAVFIDQVLHAQHESLDELRAGRVFVVRTSVEVLWVHTVPPLTLAVGLRQNAVVGHTLHGTSLVAAVADRHELLPNSTRRAVKSNPELEPLRASNFFPGSKDVLFWSDIHAVPWLVLRVPAIEVSMMVSKRDEIFGPCLGIKAD